MSDSWKGSSRLRPRVPPRTGDRWERRWTAITNWLGGQKPLNLILGAVIIICAVSQMARLL